METKTRNHFLIALVLGLASACGADGGEDGGDAVETADDIPASGCDCTIEPLGPDTDLLGGVQDLDCFCREHDCLSYEEATDTSNCSSLERMGAELFTYADCDLIRVSPPPYVGISFTYDATTHELVGAHAFSDIPAYDCSGEIVYGVNAGIRAFPDCELTERTDVCE